MRVRVLAFGTLKDQLGSASSEVELREASTVGELLGQIATVHPAAVLTGIAVGVNAEYATAEHVLYDGDEVALLPPVSGGASAPGILEQGAAEPILVALTRERIDSESLVAAAKHGEDGAVVIFDGIVRNHSRGRRTLHLDYEAYEEMALARMRQLAREARNRFAIHHVTLVHRLGRLEIGETSVLVIATAAHRAAAFEANRWLIDTLKSTVPIWKKETFSDGSVWAPGDPFPAPLAISSAGASHEG